MSEPAVRYLIVNGDDFGMSSGVSRGIVEAHRRGILTSTSFMVDRPASEYAAVLAREVPDLSIGLHLELEGRAVEDPRRAVEEQLLRFERLMRRPPTHIDSHHDVHGDPRVLPYVLEAARPLHIPVRGHSPVHCFTKFYGHWGGETHFEQVSVETLIGMLESEVTGRVTELICHPGYQEAELDSSYASVREVEIRTLCDPRVRDTLSRGEIQLVGFRDLPTLLTGGPEREVCPSWQP
jgi:predicted glycoside hydrolase/deacetylase ChbG (UPF0249 family)